MPTTRKPRPFETQALDLLAQAKAFLQANKSFTPTVFLVYPKRFEIFELFFQTAQEKFSTVAEVLATAVRTSADAIIFITDAYYKHLPSKKAMDQFKEQYCQGDLASENAREQLMMIVSPRGNSDWGLAVPYKRDHDKDVIVFSRARSSTRPPYTNNLLPESWKGRANKRAAKRNGLSLSRNK